MMWKSHKNTMRYKLGNVLKNRKNSCKITIIMVYKMWYKTMSFLCTGTLRSD